MFHIVKWYIFLRSNHVNPLYIPEFLLPKMISEVAGHLRQRRRPKSMTFTGESASGVRKSTFSGFKSRCRTPGEFHRGKRIRENIAICEPWCWYIYLQNWVIFKCWKMNSSTMEHMGYGTHIWTKMMLTWNFRETNTGVFPEKGAYHQLSCSFFWRQKAWKHIIWLVVSTPLKNIGHWEGLSHILWKIKHVPNHQPDN